MASGRVGGSRSKVSGKIGNEVYYLSRESDGSYAQVVAAKSSRPYTSNTARQAAYRMCAAIVEACMRDLQEVACISMQSAPNRSKSLNAFAAHNLMRVHRSCKNHWDDAGDFGFNVKAVDANAGGRFLLSAGSLMQNLFSKVVYCWGLPAEALPQGTTHVPNIKEVGGLLFDIPAHVTTFGEFLKFFGMTRRDQVVYVNYHVRNIEEEGDGGEDDVQIIEDNRYRWFILSVSETLPDDTPIGRDVLRTFFSIQSSDEVEIYWQDWSRQLYFVDVVRESDVEESILMHGAFSISYSLGRRKVSSSELEFVDESYARNFSNHRPCDVFWSYIGGHVGEVYPSPFEGDDDV